MAFSELKRATKAVAGTRFIDHARDPADHKEARRHWRAAKSAMSFKNNLKYEADITYAATRSAGALCGAVPQDATMHWPYVTQSFSEEEKRQFGVQRERRRKHAMKRWAFTDTLGHHAAARRQGIEDPRSHSSQGLSYVEGRYYDNTTDLSDAFGASGVTFEDDQGQQPDYDDAFYDPY